MDTPSPLMREVARRVLALEASCQADPPSYPNEAAIVCEKLRSSLTRFAGPDGFTALLRRALALARSEVPILEAVKVQADGRLEGFDALLSEEPDGGSEAGLAVTVQLLGLLGTFIGEPLTVRLVRDAWPNIALDESEGIEAS